MCYTYKCVYIYIKKISYQLYSYLAGKFQSSPFLGGHMWVLHLKLHNINLHNITHSLIYRNLGKGCLWFEFEISLLIVTFL